MSFFSPIFIYWPCTHDHVLHFAPRFHQRLTVLPFNCFFLFIIDSSKSKLVVEFSSRKQSSKQNNFVNYKEYVQNSTMDEMKSFHFKPCKRSLFFFSSLLRWRIFHKYFLFLLSNSGLQLLCRQITFLVRVPLQPPTVMRKITNFIYACLLANLI